MIVDTGLHFIGMKRDEAIQLFVDKAWDDSDFTRKEVGESSHQMKCFSQTH